MADKVKFEIIGSREYKWIERRPISAQTPPPVRGGLAWADVECPVCEHNWRSKRGGDKGDFPPVLGHENPTECPECGVHGVIVG